MKNQLTGTFIPKSDHHVILALEASANQLSIAVMVDGKVIAAHQHTAPHGHAVGIVPLSMQALADAGLGFDAITHVAAGCGPGSFTGIRVTLAAAKGFCLAYGAIGIGLSGLQALATAATNHDQSMSTPCLSLMDTRRGTLYAQLFDAGGHPLGAIFEAAASQLPLLIEASHLSRGIRLLGMRRDEVAVAFDAAGVMTDQPAIDDMPTATMMAHLAANHITLGDITPLDPLYLADPRLGPKKKAG